MVAADVPVFVGVGGGLTQGHRVVNLALHAEFQGAIGVVVNAPTRNETIKELHRTIDVPIVVTVLSEDEDIQGRIDAGVSILNISAAGRTPQVVRNIRERFPDIPIIATGGPTEESIITTVEAGANAITWTPRQTAMCSKTLWTSTATANPTRIFNRISRPERYSKRLFLQAVDFSGRGDIISTKTNREVTVMDIFELILLCALAAVFYVCALLLCGGRISLIHSYQRKNVSEENAGAYAKLYALVMFFVGSGLLAAGAINYITHAAGLHRSRCMLCRGNRHSNNRSAEIQCCQITTDRQI